MYISYRLRQCGRASAAVFAGFSASKSIRDALRAGGAEGTTFSSSAWLESLWVALFGGAMGAGLALASVRMLKATAGFAIPRLDAVRVSWRGLAFCFGAAVLAAILAGFAL